MAVYRSKYRDPKTGKLRSSDVWWYELQWDHKRIRKSTNQASKRVAEQMEAAYRTALAKGEVGILERKAAPTLKEFAPKFQREIETACARKPRTVSFYLDKLRILLRNDTLASASLDDIDEQMIDGYKQTRARSLSRYKRLLCPASTISLG
jgi:hypothetical protein